MKKQLRVVGIIGVAIASCALLFGGIGNQKVQANDSERIYEGVYLGTVDVGGLTVQEAREEFNRYMADLGNVTVEFALEDETCSIAMSELELQADIEESVQNAFLYGRQGNILKRYREITDISNENVKLPIVITLNEETLVNRLNESLSDYIVPASEATLKMEDGKLVVVGGVNGKELNAENTVDSLKVAIDAWNGSNEMKVEVATNELEPTHSTSELSQVTDVIGSFETTFSLSDKSRNNNIANAASKISGNVVYPGDEFDTMSHLVPFTEANGWSYAGAYLNGEVISDIGGGICQVSTTLYNAVLKAELEVVERHPHSMAVGYVQLSADAALNEGTKNFIFRNDTDTPIYIYSYASNGVMHVTLYGKETRDTNRSVEYKNEIVEVYDPGEPIETVDESQPADYRSVTQSAHTGYSAKLWKYVYVNGELQDTILVNTSYYAASPQRVTIGKPEEVPAEAPAEGQPADNPNPEAPEQPAPEEPSTEAPAQPAPNPPEV